MRWGSAWALAPVSAEAARRAHHAPAADISPTWLVAKIEQNGSVIPVGDSDALMTQPEAVRHPASITKLALALVVMEKMSADQRLMDEASAKASTMAPAQRKAFLKDFVGTNDIRFPQGPQTIVTFSRKATATSGNSSGMPVGTKIGAGMLLAVTIAHSANDGAMALAEHGWGNEETCVAAMNARAASAGMKNTKFATCNGQDWMLPEAARNNVTTATDVARLMTQFIPYLDNPVAMTMLAPRIVEVPGRVPRIYQSLESDVLGRNMSRAAGGTLDVELAKGGINLLGRYNNAMMLSDGDGARYAVVVLHEPNQSALEVKQQSAIAALDYAVNGPANLPRARHRPRP